jgi:hypothetical protein
VDWANERYVRVYVRDTIGTKRLSWEARCLFWELLRKVDRAGVLDLSGFEPADGLSVALDVPEDVAGRCLAEWSRDGRAAVEDGRIVVRSMIPAQETAQSDRARARESRERRAACAESQPVTPCHAPSRAVTASHAPSQSVTLSSLNSPDSPSVPSRSEREAPEAPTPAAPAHTPRARRKAGVPIPEDFAPGKAHADFARVHNIDLQLEWQKFKCDAEAEDRRHVRWGAAFSKWLANSAGWQRERAAGRQSFADHATRKSQPLPVPPELFAPRTPQARPSPPPLLNLRPTPPTPVAPPPRPAETDAEREARVAAAQEAARAALAEFVARERAAPNPGK